MTYDEITLWRRFMESEGVLNNFEFLYNSHRFDKRDINQYLDSTEAEDVILSAFDYSAASNTIFGFKFWKEINTKWQTVLKSFRESGKLELPEVHVLCPHCKRMMPKSAFLLKSNGTMHKHCKDCETGKWDRERKEKLRKEKEESLLQEEAKQIEKAWNDNNKRLHTLTKVCTRCGQRKLRQYFYPSENSSDGLQTWCIDCQKIMEKVVSKSEKKYDNMEPTSADKNYPPKLGEYDATLHFKENKKSITFNSTLSELLKDCRLTKCYMKQGIADKLFFVFNKVEGANIVAVSSRSSLLYGINSADYCKTIAQKYHLSLGEIYYLRISKNLSRQKDVVTIEINCVRTKEEFMAISHNKHMEQCESGESEMISNRLEETTPQPVVPKPTDNRESSLNNIGTTSDILIQEILDRNIVTERDLAAFLHKRGWKLQEPVTSYKKFTL